jgi:hypothetical protein
MASYTYTQLYGSGSIGETINDPVFFEFNNPSGSSYFTMETIPASTGFYEASSPKNFIGTYVNSIHPYTNPTNPSSMNPWGLITSSYIASVVVPPGYSSFNFYPTITVTGTTYRLRGTGGYSLFIDIFP